MGDMTITEIVGFACYYVNRLKTCFSRARISLFNVSPEQTAESVLANIKGKEFMFQ